MLCYTNEMCSFITIQTNRCGSSCLFNLVVAKFECKYPVCECSLVVVRHIVYCERFGGYRADVPWFANKICLFSTIKTVRCGRICFYLTLSLPNLNAFQYRVCVCSLGVVRHIVYCERFGGYRADVSWFTNKIC